MLRLKRILFLLLLATAAAFGTTPPVLTPPVPEEGEINGAKFIVARPAHWNRAVLLVAPGQRRENQPLVAQLDPAALAYKTYLDEGWIVATTSFRRSGVIVADAIADLDALRAYIVETYGQPQRVIVEGEAMGGLIATLIAEREPALYSGVVAISPSLQLQELSSRVGLSLQPKIPLLFLVNQNELPGPQAYLASKLIREATTVVPVLFGIARGGHANVNQRERLMALRALNVWLSRGASSLPPLARGETVFDATVAPEPQPSQVAMHEDRRGFDTRVTALSPLYGTALLDVQPADFAAADIKPYTWFKLTAHGKTFRTFYGRDFNSVKKNEWVVFPSADGYFILARNLSNAAAGADLAVDEVVSLKRYEPLK